MTGRNRVTCCFFGDGAFAEGSSRDRQPRRALGTALAAGLREQPLRNGHGPGRPPGPDRPRARPPGTAWSPGPSTARTSSPSRTQPGGRPKAYVPEPDRTSWRCTRTASAPTPCTTPTVTATRPRSSTGRSANPVEGLARRLRDAKELSDKARTALEDRLSAEIDGAVEAAEQAPDEPVEDLLKYVTSPAGRAGHDRGSTPVPPTPPPPTGRRPIGRRCARPCARRCAPTSVCS